MNLIASTKRGSRVEAMYSELLKSFPFQMLLGNFLLDKSAPCIRM